MEPKSSITVNAAPTFIRLRAASVYRPESESYWKQKRISWSIAEPIWSSAASTSERRTRLGGYSTP